MSVIASQYQKMDCVRQYLLQMSEYHIVSDTNFLRKEIIGLIQISLVFSPRELRQSQSQTLNSVLKEAILFLDL